ncbi:hypothetical protein F2Q69_00021858 [Brassica cretica]|uniref:Uncharacterized protein n=1 Tax=Brassica cretica TaxID=69181 RepID=A0A8S9Q630_BRACR|nr:hypothetical protein F2Q69_00021858 [Brassica cretica]
MSSNQRASDSAFPSSFYLESLRTQEGEIVLKPEFVAHFVNPTEAVVYWLSTCDIKPPPHKSWYPIKIRANKSGEHADTPPNGYFKCYETHLLRCRLWFPIPEIMVQTLDRFGMSISQICLSALQHLIGIPVLSYERGMTLDVNYFEVLLMLKKNGGLLKYSLTPRPLMSIPDLPAEEDLDPSMDGYIPYDILVERERERSPKNKHVAVDEGDAAADSPDLDAFFSSIGTDFDPLLADGEAAESSQLKKASRMCNMGLHLLNEALNASCAGV